MNRNISIEIIYQVYEHVNSGVILGQNCIQLSDTALNDLFFFKNLFYQKQCKYARTTGVAQIICALYIFLSKQCCQMLPSISKIIPVANCKSKNESE